MIVKKSFFFYDILWKNEESKLTYDKMEVPQIENFKILPILRKKKRNIYTSFIRKIIIDGGKK